MSLFAPDLVPSTSPLRDLAPDYRGDAAGMVRVMEQVAVDRWFAVDVLVVPATRPIHPTERVVAAVSRAAGPIALALGFLLPAALLLR